MNLRLVAFRLLSLLGLAFSMAMLVDALSPTPAFCSFQAGCDGVTHSAYGRLLGGPLSAWGAAAFAGFYVATFLPHRAARYLGPAAVVAGALGLALMAVQLFVLRRVCPFCLLIDAAALLLAVVELALPAPATQSPQQTPPDDAATPTWTRTAWLAAGLSALAAAPLWATLKPAPQMPAAVRALQTAGAVRLVEITDFACPHCRVTHPAIGEFLRRHPEVALTRFVAPLPAHADGRPPARAYLAAVRQGRGEALAELLFATDDRSSQHVRELATNAGLDLTRYDADVADPALDQELDATLAWVEAADTGGLPQLWLADLPLLGAQTLESLEGAWARLRRRPSDAAAVPRLYDRSLVTGNPR